MSASPDSRTSRHFRPSSVKGVLERLGVLRIARGNRLLFHRRATISQENGESAVQYRPTTVAKRRTEERNGNLPK
jgi:hypothetical protein